MKRTPVSAALTFYTEANELGMAGYKARNSSKVIQSPYSSVKKSELYTILIVLLNFNDSLNMITDSQYRFSTQKGLYCTQKLMDLFLIIQN